MYQNQFKGKRRKMFDGFYPRMPFAAERILLKSLCCSNSTGIWCPVSSKKSDFIILKLSPGNIINPLA
jgi:hypothetical protein